MSQETQLPVNTPANVQSAVQSPPMSSFDRALAAMAKTASPPTPVVTTPPPAVEPPVASPTAGATETKPEGLEATRFAALARKEKALVDRQQAIKAQESALEARSALASEFERLKASARLDPVAALSALGITPDDVNQFVLNDKRPTPDANVKAIRDELDAFKKQSAAAELARVESEKKRLIDEFDSGVLDFVKSNTEQYELTNLNDAGRLVLDVIKETFETSGRLMQTSEAADLVEKYLEEQVDRNLQTKKLKARVQLQSSQPPKETEKPADPASQPSLTNRLTASGQSFTSSQNKESDRMARALAALEGRK